MVGVFVIEIAPGKHVFPFEIGMELLAELVCFGEPENHTRNEFGAALAGCVVLILFVTVRSFAKLGSIPLP